MDTSLLTKPFVAMESDADTTHIHTLGPCHIRKPRSSIRLHLRSAFRSFSDMAIVIVGDSSDPNNVETKYLVHRELLAAASPFFAAALSGGFSEGQEQTIRLADEQPQLFDWFVQWLYTGSLMTTVAPTRSGSLAARKLPDDFDFEACPSQLIDDYGTIQVNGDLCNNAGSPKYFLLIELWAMSDRLLTTGFSNLILSTITRLSESTNSVLTPKDTCMLYEKIREGAPIRALILDLFAYKKTDKLLETHSDEWHPRFMRDLVVKLKRPGRESVERHDLIPWRSRTWSLTRACELCRQTLKPGVGAEKCRSCDQVFCASCLRKVYGDASAYALPHESSGCKPWTGMGLCLRYHEHAYDDCCA